MNMEKTDGTAGKTANKNGTRVERWHRLAAWRISRMDAKTMPGACLLRACAAAEGMAPADLIVDRLKWTRAGGREVERRPDDITGAEYNAWTDTECERAGARVRNAHERRVVSSMLWLFTGCAGLTDDVLWPHGERFVRNFYHRGDVGIAPAFRRMVASALAGLETENAKTGEMPR